MSGPEEIGRVVRSGLEESVHLGHIAVCDESGALSHYLGDPRIPVFARSSMKPLQAAVCLDAIEEELRDEQVAVMCASHNGEAVHVEAVLSILQAAGLGFDDLLCPPDYPIDPDTAARARCRRPELHNCSGKHAGKLLACRRKGWDLRSYLDRSHPLQQGIQTAVEQITGISDLHVGVDGCGSPVHGLPLQAMATLYARLGAASSLGPLRDAAQRCMSAMRRAPYLVAGKARVDTALMEVAPGVVVKTGAEGLLCAAVIDGGIGVAVKVADGEGRAAGPALFRALETLGVLDQRQVTSLVDFASPPVIGGGAVVGRLESEFELHRV
ncbi:MAG TPA: asparaginase [Actinomycetota bacterium]|nr:asparaginase [Actinomycetota bacterium]